ncbi:hypothetical protein NDU88_001714 [Pleurodeles waltl]|uniref:Uncharacterized protein n=1 Tax=Pleurodeles waltl TaxID=8319 RepID=A0AAV7W0A2_PLEWA|nr:hypothetical protein NDU88_001714 [Pleurodeles waltl]
MATVRSVTGRPGRRVHGTPGALVTPIGFTRKHCRLSPISDDFRGAQASKEPSGTHTGVWVQKTRKKAQDHSRTETNEGIPWRDWTTQLVTAYRAARTLSGPRDTATRWFREPGTGGPGGGKPNNPATLWGERGLSRCLLRIHLEGRNPEKRNTL